MLNLYKNDPSTFLKMLQVHDDEANRSHKLDMAALRQQRDDERAQWEAERKDWHAAEFEDLNDEDEEMRGY